MQKYVAHERKQLGAVEMPHFSQYGGYPIEEALLLLVVWKRDKGFSIVAIESKTPCAKPKITVFIFKYETDRIIDQSVRGAVIF